MEGSKKKWYNLRPWIYRQQLCYVVSITVLYHAMNKCSLSKGLWALKYRGGGESISKYPQQLYYHKTWDTWSFNFLSSDDRRKSLKNLIFLKDKIYLEVKGWILTDDRKQSRIKKEDMMYPTAVVKYLLLPIINNSIQVSNASCTEVPVAYLRSDI